MLGAWRWLCTNVVVGLGVARSTPASCPIRTGLLLERPLLRETSELSPTISGVAEPCIPKGNFRVKSGCSIKGATIECDGFGGDCPGQPRNTLPRHLKQNQVRRRCRCLLTRGKASNNPSRGKMPRKAAVPLNAKLKSTALRHSVTVSGVKCPL